MESGRHLPVSSLWRTAFSPSANLILPSSNPANSAQAIASPEGFLCQILWDLGLHGEVCFSLLCLSKPWGFGLEAGSKGWRDEKALRVWLSCVLGWEWLWFSLENCERPAYLFLITRGCKWRPLSQKGRLVLFRIYLLLATPPVLVLPLWAQHWEPCRPGLLFLLC